MTERKTSSKISSSLYGPISGKLFLDPVQVTDGVVSDGKTYERTCILKYLNEHDFVTPEGVTLNKDSILVFQNASYSDKIIKVLERHPEKILEQFQIDVSYENNKSRVQYIIENNLFEQLKNFNDYNLNDMSSEMIIAVLRNSDDSVVYHILNNSVSHEPTYGRYIVENCNNDLIVYFLEHNKDVPSIQKKNYYFRLLLDKKNFEVLNFVCKTYDLDVNVPRSGSPKGNTPLMLFIRAYSDKDDVPEEDRVPKELLDLFLTKWGNTFNWNKTNKAGESALSMLFEDKTISWPKTQKFLKYYDEKPDFMQGVRKTDVTVLHLVCIDGNIDTNFVRFLAEFHRDNVDFNRNSETSNSTPFSNMCNKCHSIDTIRFTYDEFAIFKDKRIIEILMTKVNQKFEGDQSGMYQSENLKGFDEMERLLLTIAFDFTTFRDYKIQNGHFVVDFDTTHLFNS